MTISNEAVEKAAIAFHGAMEGPVSFPADWHGEIRAALEAAAPIIRADAWDAGMTFATLLLNGDELIPAFRKDNPHRARAAAERGRE